jgi:ribose/xylose/arabinose/galactoside ABC-type transport system permease subunit
MKKALGIFALLVFVYALAALLNPDFVSTYNIQNTLRRTALFGIISIGVAFVIITGGIDLSIGSLIGLIGCLLPMALQSLAAGPPGRALAWTLIGTGAGVWLAGAIWLHSLPFRDGVRRGMQVLLVPGYVVVYAARRYDDCKRPLALYALGLGSVVAGWLLPAIPLPPAVEVALAVFWMLEISVAVGLLHGMLITRIRLQPFVVTLCGLLLYRGLARWVTDDQTQGFGTGYEGLKSLVSGRPFSMVWLLLGAGLSLIAWGLVRRASRRRERDDEDALVPPWCLTLVGLVLTLACVLTWAPWLPETARNAPSWTQRAVFWAGLVGTVCGSLGLTLSALVSRSWGIVRAAALTIISLLMLAGLAALGYVGGGSDLAWWKIVAVALTLLALMTGVAQFLQTNWQASSGARRPATFLTASAGVLLLLGLTPLDRVPVPAPLLVLLVIAVAAGLFLNQTIYGRYLLALGRNEEAARYSGINTSAMIVVAYVICALLAGLAAVLFSLDVNGIQPAGHGNFYELYAISAAVLGGCSLRGGEGSILGVVIGTAVMRVLYNAITMLGIPDKLEFAMIGAVLLLGVIVDELLRRAGQRP